MLVCKSEAERQELDRLVLSSSQVVVVGNRAGVIEWANEGWRELIGVPLDDAGGKPIASILDRFEVDPGVVAYVSRKFLAGEECQVEFPFLAPGGWERWLRVRVKPLRDDDGDVSRFIATGDEITQRVEETRGKVDECNVSSLVGECAGAVEPELGPRASYDALLCEDLLPAYADPVQLAALVRYLIRCSTRAIDDEWGTISLTTGLVGLGEEPIGTRYLAEGMPVGPYLFVEVHDTGVTDLAEAQSRVSDPFMPSLESGRGVSFPNAIQFVSALGGRIEVEHDEPFGTSIAIVLPA